MFCTKLHLTLQHSAVKYVVKTPTQGSSFNPTAVFCFGSVTGFTSQVGRGKAEAQRTAAWVPPRETSAHFGWWVLNKMPTFFIYIFARLTFSLSPTFLKRSAGLILALPQCFWSLWSADVWIEAVGKQLVSCCPPLYFIHFIFFLLNDGMDGLFLLIQSGHAIQWLFFFFFKSLTFTFYTMSMKRSQPKPGLFLSFLSSP